MGLIDKLTVKPWLTAQRRIDDLDEGGAFALPTAKVGLWVFLGVVVSLFSLLAFAYSMRMELSDWQPLSEPWLLWLNTALLVLSSIALQWAHVSAERGNIDSLWIGLLAGGGFAAAFLAGQLIAWQQLGAAGYFAASNPANAFFYLITALHGLHLVGGLVAWSKTTAKMWGGCEVAEVRLAVELCAVYWHFLLLVWLLLFGLLLST